MGTPPDREPTFFELMTPDGFHSFDFRWALNAAFDLQMDIGRKRVHQRTAELSSRLKKGMRSIRSLDLITSMDPDLSAGINCFMVNGLSAEETVVRFHENGVVASSPPYRESNTFCR